MMHAPAWDEKNLAWSDTLLASIDDPRQVAVETINRLVERLVAMRYRHPRTGRNRELEHRKTSRGLFGLQPEPDVDLSDTYDVVPC
jgi:hypothetical protein